MTRSRQLALAALAATALFQVACPKPKETAPPATTAPTATTEPSTPKPAPPPAPERPRATATIAGAAGSTVQGTVVFTDTGNGIAIEAHLTGLAPGKHGFHIHEVGDCSGDFSKAGAHFNPEGHQHGGPDSAAPHNGDLGNLLAGPDGTAMITMTSRHITLDQSATGIVGRSVVVHEKEDDLATPPSGNSGNRIGCGVIQLEAAGASGAMPAPAAPAPTETPAAGASGPGNH